MLACRHPGCSSSGWRSRVGSTRFSGRAAGVKNRYASKWVHRTVVRSTTSAVPVRPRRNGKALCRTSGCGCRYTMAHSCRPKQVNWAGRDAVATSRSRIHASDSRRRAMTASVSTVAPSPRTDVVATEVGRVGADELDAGPGMPAPQLRRPVRVVREEEVLDRMLHAEASPVEVGPDPAVHARLVRGPAGAPRRGLQDRHQSSLGLGQHRADHGRSTTPTIRGNAVDLGWIGPPEQPKPSKI